MLIRVGYRLGTINSLPPNLIYRSASETAKELAPQLREQGADIVIAVTHQREPNDNKLAKNMPPGLIDIILGGHDHFYGHSLINSTHVQRSGSDFKQLSYIEAWRKMDGPGWDFTITRRDVVRAIPEHADTVHLVDKMTASLQAKLQKPIGYTATSLDGRFKTVRRAESNLGNFVCDLMRFYHDADCGMMAAGTIRGDQIYPPGVIRIRDIMNCFPFEDPVVVLRLKGKAIRAALENGVSLFPALEGRFPHVSNIKYGFSSSKPPGSRLVWAKIGGEDIDDERKYTLATRGYMARGKDGYDALLVQSEGGEAEEVVSEEDGLLISTIVRQYFLSLKIVGKWRRFSQSLNRHWDTVNKNFHRDSRVRRPSGTPASPRKADAATSVSTASFPYVTLKRTNTAPAGSIEDENEVEMDSDSDSDADVLSRPRNYVTQTAVSPEDGDRREFLARQVLRRWRERVGMDHSKVKTVDEAEDETLPPWTRVIAPTLEERIVQVD